MNRAILGGKTETIKALIKSPGIDVNNRNNYDEIPLSFAIQEGWYDVIAELIKAEADLNAQDINGLTPLRSYALWAPANFGSR